jgi:hypothetical protein
MGLGRALASLVNEAGAYQTGTTVDDEENDKTGRHLLKVLHLFSSAILNAVSCSA